MPLKLFSYSSGRAVCKAKLPLFVWCSDHSVRMSLNQNKKKSIVLSAGYL